MKNCEKYRKVARDILMARRSEEDRWKVITYHNDGMSCAEIARRTCFNYQFVEATVTRHQELRSVSDRARSGRPRKRTLTVSQEITKLAKAKRHRSTRRVARIAKQRNIADMSHETVRTILKSAYLTPYRRRKKPRLSQQQKDKRLQFAQHNRDKDWTKTIFTDEKKFVLFEDTNSHNDVVWCDDPLQVCPVEVEKWKILVHAYAAISHRGLVVLHFYTPPLNALEYQRMLRTQLVPSANAQFKDAKWELQHDGATCHTARSTQNWLQANVPKFIAAEHWPPNSPDCNPIERIFGIVADRLAFRRPTTTRGYRTVIHDEFNKLTLNEIRATIDALGQRLIDVAQGRGAFP